MLKISYPIITSGPPRASRIVMPRDLQQLHSRERHVVAGGCALLLQMGQGDSFTLVNDEGGQHAEIIAARLNGQIDAALIGQTSNSDAGGLKSLLSAGAMEPSLARLRSGLAVRGIDLSKAGATAIFRCATAAKTSVNFNASEAGWLVVAAPGDHMLPGEQSTLTPLTLLVERAARASSASSICQIPWQIHLQDIRVKSADRARPIL